MLYTAGIVTFNPSIDRLRQNIRMVKSQFDKLVIYDNASYNVSEIEDYVSNFTDIEIIKSSKNRGIGVALNVIMEKGMQYGSTWVLLLDQDSVIPYNMMEEYLPMTNGNKIGIICPQLMDIHVQSTHDNTKIIEEVGICITSGSYTNVNVWKEVGGFREDFFIDSVDNEYCIRLYFKGYKILRNNNVILSHELGKGERHKFKNTTNHNSMRRYYIARNSTYVAKVYEPIAQKRFSTKEELNACFNFLDRLICKKTNYRRQLQFILLVMLYEKNKFQKILAIIKGVYDGNKMDINVTLNGFIENRKDQ